MRSAGVCTGPEGWCCMSTLTHRGSGVKCSVCLLSEIPLESERLPLVNQNWHVARQELISTDWHFLMDSCFVVNFMSSCTSNCLACLDEVQGHKCWTGTRGEMHQPNTCHPCSPVLYRWIWQQLSERRQSTLLRCLEIWQQQHLWLDSSE